MVRWYDKWFARQLIASDKKKPDFSLEKIIPYLFGVAGKVLEIGPGAGNTLAHLSLDVQYTALEPNTFFHSTLVEAGKARGFKNSEIVNGFVENIPFPDETFDSVVAVRTLCSAADVMKALSEIKRVLKPGGTFIFSEHVGAPRKTWLRFLQLAYRPIDRLWSGGCDIARDTEKAIRAAGFKNLVVEGFSDPENLIDKPRIYGIGQK